MIEIKNVSFTYEGRNNDALTELNLTVNSGECVVICGGSGSGKTTITRLINGLIPSFYSGELKGDILIDGAKINEKAPHELTEVVGSVFQNPRTQFFSTDTDSELVFAMENCGFNRDEMLKRYADTISDLSLSELCGRNIENLSGGEKQKIAFGGVYALSPNVYVLDEPSANLDLDGVAMLGEVIAKLKAQGKTVLIAEHRIYYLKDIADRVVIMESGKVKNDIAMNELRKLSDSELADMGLRTLTGKRTVIESPSIKKPNIALEITDLAAAYQDNTVFDNFNLTVEMGDIVGIVGRNGRGKSTLMNILCGAKKEKSGKIRFAGAEVKAKHRNREAYLVMQDPNYQLFCDSVYAELALSRCGEDFSSDEIDEVLNLLGLAEFKDYHPLSLSGGQKQRLAVAVAYLNKANVIMFDEPTSGLDYNNMIAVSAVIKCLSERGKTILVISHDDEFMSKVCNKKIKM